MKIVWPKSALAQLKSVYPYIALEDAVAARRVILAIQHAAGRLAEFPELGRSGTVPGTRELIITKLPYVLVYRVAKDEVQILRVFHMAMDWQ